MTQAPVLAANVKPDNSTAMRDKILKDKDMKGFIAYVAQHGFSVDLAAACAKAKFGAGLTLMCKTASNAPALLQSAFQILVKEDGEAFSIEALKLLIHAGLPNKNEVFYSAFSRSRLDVCEMLLGVYKAEPLKAGVPQGYRPLRELAIDNNVSPERLEFLQRHGLINDPGSYFLYAAQKKNSGAMNFLARCYSIPAKNYQDTLETCIENDFDAGTSLILDIPNPGFKILAKYLAWTEASMPILSKMLALPAERIEGDRQAVIDEAFSHHVELGIKKKEGFPIGGGDHFKRAIMYYEAGVNKDYLNRLRRDHEADCYFKQFIRKVVAAKHPLLFLMAQKNHIPGPCKINDDLIDCIPQDAENIADFTAILDVLIKAGHKVAGSKALAASIQAVRKPVFDVLLDRACREGNPHATLKSLFALATHNPVLAKDRSDLLVEFKRGILERQAALLHLTGGGEVSPAVPAPQN